MDITISDKQMKPAVIHTNQFEDGVHQLTFTIADCRQGTIDLRDYKAYAVTSYNGVPDITEVKYTVSGHTMTLTWDVSAWTLRQPGIIQFQIRFSSSEKDGTAVWYSYKGVLINRLSINADDYVSAQYPTVLKQIMDEIQTLAGTFDSAVLYMQPGATVDVSQRLANRLYYQIENTTTNEGHFEDHNGNRLGEFNAKHVADPDLNTMLAHGEYFCVGLLNSELHFPVSCTIAFLHITDSGSANQQLQTLYCVENNQIRTFVRSVKGTDFGTWQELATTDYVDSALSGTQGSTLTNANAVVVTDSTGKITSSTVTATELGYLDGVTSNIQTQLNGKASSTHSHAISDITNLQTSLDNKQNKNLGSSNANMVLVTDAEGNISASQYITTTELNALNGFITGGGTVQAQIDALTSKVNSKYSYLNYSGKSYLVGSINDFESWAADSQHKVTVTQNGMLLFYFNTSSTDGTIEKIMLTIGATVLETFHIHSGTELFSLPFEANTVLTFDCENSIKVKIIQLPFK